MHPKPAWYHEPSPEEEAKRVMFNDDVLEPNGRDLNYFPVVRDDTALIYADYFPKFMIDVTQAGDTITLHGQLHRTGHTAVVKIGSTDATLDGVPLTLSGRPCISNGRLYLPYELLQKCNGVLTRWEAKKKVLWVDTRYLRRDQ